MSCVFCEIIKKSRPADIVWEDSNTVCFLPLDIECFGHVLVVPKKHLKNIFNANKSDLACLMFAIKAVSRLLRSKLSAEGVNILSANGTSAQQSIEHLHFHLIPRFANDKLDLWPHFPKKKLDRKKILDLLIA